MRIAGEQFADAYVKSVSQHENIGDFSMQEKSKDSGQHPHLPLTAFFASTRSCSEIRPVSSSHINMEVGVGIVRPPS